MKTLLPDLAQFTAVQDNQSRLCCQTGLSLQLFRTTSQDSVARLGSVYSCSGQPVKTVARLGSVYSYSGQPVKTLLSDWAQFTAIQDNQ